MAINRKEKFRLRAVFGLLMSATAYYGNLFVLNVICHIVMACFATYK